MKINLFHLENYIINTGDYDNLLHDKIVGIFEQTIADYVGAKYAVALNSATNAIFLSLIGHNTTVAIPSIIPPVVANAIITSGSKIAFYDNIDWVGDSYILHKFKDYKIVDSAQKLEKNQFIKECDPNDLMIFSFYPTKPIGSCDGGMIVSNDLDKIRFFKEMSLNGMTFSENNWDRTTKYAGYKFYMNSIQADIALRNFMKYGDKLKKLDYIRNTYNKALKLNNSSYHLYRFNVNDNKSFINFMSKKGIVCGIHYECLHNNPVYNTEPQTLPISEKESRTTTSIPFHEKLEDEDLQYIIKCIYEFSNK